jgi:hypothetical protein
MRRHHRRPHARPTLLLVIAFLIAALPSSAFAQSSLGIGGGASFAPGATFPFVTAEQDQLGRIETSMSVQNLSDLRAEFVVNAGLPPGASIELLDEEPLILDPGEFRRVPIAVVVGAAVPEGRYDVIITIEFANPPRPPTPGSVYAPAVGGQLTLLVQSASAVVTIAPVNRDDGSPVSGDITLSYLDRDVQPVLLERVNGSTLRRSVVPGTYRATFDAPAVERQVVDFDVAEGEERTVVIEVPGVQFRQVGALPRFDADGRVVTAELLAVVNNSFERIAGPVSVDVIVTRDGTIVETYPLAQLAELAEGVTEQRSSYRPVDGFAPGEWSFTFRLTAPTFTLVAERSPSFEVLGFLRRNLGLVVLGASLVIGLVVLALRSRWFAARRRRRREEDRDEPDGPSS